MRRLITVMSCVLFIGACQRVRPPEVTAEPVATHPSSQVVGAPTQQAAGQQSAHLAMQGGGPGSNEPCPCHHHGGGATVMHANAPLPGASLYHLDATWTTQDNNAMRLGSLRGHPVLVLMFYGTCHGACPVLIHDLQRIDAALDPATRADTRVVMISFDPEHDTPEHLRELANESHLDTTRFSLLHGSDNDVRNVAAVLGVQYARTAEGFNHSNQIMLLDRDGVPSFTLEGLGQPVEEIVRRTQALAANHAHN
jgi:protein SCO1/2